MAETTRGVVDYLKTGDDFGFVRIAEESGGLETLILWFVDESRGPVGMYMMQLSLALAHGLTVELTHEDDSAYIQQVKVLRASP